MKDVLDYERHFHGDKKRFLVREYNSGKFQVFGVGLEHVCECDSDEVAKMIADALEFQANRAEIKKDASPFFRVVGPGDWVTTGGDNE